MNGRIVRAIGAVLGVIFCGFTASVAHADAAGWYIGGSIGEARFDGEQQALDARFVSLFEELRISVLSGSSSLDDSDTAFALFAGYRFSPYFALEGGYQSLGKFSYRADGLGRFFFPVPSSTFPVSATLDVESSGLALAGVGGIPLGESFDLHGKLGVLFADTDVSGAMRIVDTGETFLLDSASSQHDLFYGVGAAFHFGGAWSMSLDYQIFKDVGDAGTGEADVEMVSLGLSYRF